jgi:hypothetical protein
VRRFFRYRVGRRGAALLVFAWLDAVIAYSLTDSSVRAQTATLPVYRVIVSLAPLLTWAILWATVGAACFVSAFLKDDRWGFAAAISVKVVWAAGFAAAWVVYGADRAWIAAATWLVLALLVLDIAGWREVTRE